MLGSNSHKAAAAAVVAGLLAASAVVQPAKAGPVFASASYSAAVNFNDALFSTTMTIAFDGTNYWSTSGGGPSGTRYAEYNSSGALISTFAPGLDFRSVFTNASGNVFARAYNNNTIYSQTSPGSFTPSGIVLAGPASGNSQEQASVVLNGAGTEYIALNNNGVVRRWTLAGAALSSVNLVGFSGVENTYPQNRGIAAAGNYWFTLSNGLLSAWDPLTGARLDQTTLIGLGTGFDTNFSLSYANGMFFGVTAAHGQWLGFNVGNFSGSPTPAPAPGAIVVLALGLFGISTLRRRGR